MLLLDQPIHTQLLALLGEEASLPFLSYQAVAHPSDSTGLPLSAVQQENLLDALSHLLQTRGITVGKSMRLA
jgi:hypothetical protein